MPPRKYDPDNPLVSTMRSLEDYVVNNMSTVYDIQMAFPSLDAVSKASPFEKTVIHFDIDRIDDHPLGLGDNVVDYVIVEEDTTVTDLEAHIYIFRLNVGIWASQQSGGASSRLKALQELHRLFHGPGAQQGCFDYTEGLDPIEFTGGTFFPDTINDLPVWRAGDMELSIRVFSRRTPGPLIYPTEYVLEPGVDIDGIVLVEDYYS